MQNTDRQPDGPAGPSAKLKSWLYLLIGVAILWVFMQWVGPLIFQLPGFSSMARLIKEQNIHTTGFFYTDIEEHALAASVIRDRLAYAPQMESPAGIRVEAFDKQTP